ncbi:5'-hydroxyaverantin dehydrogenase, partial [Pseudocercospora fuligena]
SVPIDFTKQYDLSTLKERTALVTGGASGIGAGIVKALGEAGAYVVIADINQEAGEKYSFDLDAIGCKTLFVRTDAQEFSPNDVVDIVIAGAGIAGASITQVPPFVSASSGDPIPPKPSVDMVDVNLTGVLYTATLAAGRSWSLEEFSRYHPIQDLKQNELARTASRRAIQVNPGKAFDLHDDMDDMDGANIFKEYWENDTRLVYDLFDESRQMSMS